MIPGPETKMRREASQMLTAPKAAKIRKEILLRMPVGFASEKETGDQTDKVRQVSPRVHPANTAAALEKLCCV